ncbi:MAG: hypothetical protein ACT4QD_23155 [Acidobacteriota bacterium]
MKLLAVVLACGVGAAAASNVTKAQADAFQKKLIRMAQLAEVRSDPNRETRVTQDEVNSYLHFSAGDQLPVGVTDPSVTIQRDGRLGGRAVVDLDRVRRQRGTGGWLDPTSYMTGRLAMTATGVLITEGGRGRFRLETAAIASVPIPKALLQEIVSYYTRRDDLPDGLNIDDPFELPAAIQRIDTSEGSATIVQ